MKSLRPLPYPDLYPLVRLRAGHRVLLARAPGCGMLRHPPVRMDKD